VLYRVRYDDDGSTELREADELSPLPPRREGRGRDFFGDFSFGTT